MVKGAGI